MNFNCDPTKQAQELTFYCKLQTTNPPLITIYNSFIRPHFDHGDMIMIKLSMCRFYKKWKSFSNMQLQQ